MLKYTQTLTSTMRICELHNWGIVPYQKAWDYQRSQLQKRIENPHLNDLLILLEHPPVYTLGTGATLDYLKFDPHNTTAELHRIERGGEVTYHCPGQIVGYPILNLRFYQQDLHWYLRQLEEVLIQVLKQYNLPAYRLKGFTGVWLENRKIAAIGIKVSRWITMHGFALNVNPNLSGFQQIIPCGIADKPVGSLAQFIPEITIAQVRQDIVVAFAEVFGVTFLKQEI
ncbi:MAG: lipoyl(octanoyl) transferase LipB [Jaaginema sp. PMC 1080.18]|nr:lipoyl(octanoyl) transferase LipB [Jaaginema sp. PMC 1080.18]MEC4869031.1 lipoyl(octanoyl) transferase LipB [Jaaginema sp. PMC 1078.18]